MFLLHRRLGGVDGFTDAAQLHGEKNDRNEVTQPTSPPTHDFHKCLKGKNK